MKTQSISRLSALKTALILFFVAAFSAVSAQTPDLTITASTSVIGDWNTTYNVGLPTEINVATTGAIASKKPCGASANASTLSLSSSESHYLEFALPTGSTATINKIVLRMSGNSTGTTDYFGPVFYCPEESFNTDNVTGVYDAHFTGYDQACTDQEITFPAGTKSCRYYRRAKWTSPTGSTAGIVGSGSNYGSGQTTNISYIEVYLNASAAPATPTITAFVVSGVTAAINQTAKTITATLPNGSILTSLTPTVTTANATSYSPTGAQNFSSPVTYSVTDGTTTTTYNVTLSVAPATASTDATLSDLKVDGTTVSGFSASTTSYNVQLPSTYSGVPVVSATVNHSAATAAVTQATAVPGTASVLVTAENGSTTQIYTINFTKESGSVTPPSSTLALHEPELYETPTPLGGYGTNLTTYSSREYEVYYICQKSDVSYITAGTSYNSNTSAYQVATIPTTDAGTFSAPWLSFSQLGVSGSTTLTKEEFNGDGSGASVHYAKVSSASLFEIRISGYDQFSFIGRDNGTSAGKMFTVEIDGVQQTFTHSSSDNTIYRFAISSSEHVIRVSGDGTSESRFRAFSLRISDNPRVKYVSGNDATQVVNQTKAMQPVTYALRGNGSLSLSWVGTAAAGVSMSMNATNDTAVVSGSNVTAAVGTYTYKISAMQGTTEYASTTGTFSVQTEVRAINGADNTSVNINEQMLPAVFEYDAVNDADVQLTWTAGSAPAGLSVQTDNAANTISITGTPTLAGSYGFTVVATGGNTISGTIAVVVPAPTFVAPENVSSRAKATQLMTNVVWTVKYASGATATGLPNGVQGSYNNGTFTISGTPAAETSYPKTYNYTITATAQYTGQPNVTAQGSIVVISPEAQSILYLYKGTSNDAIYDYLSDLCDITVREAAAEAKSASEYNFYDILVLSESIDATNVEALNIIQNVDKPVLNFKSFTYSSSRLGWGTPDNGATDNLSITVKQPSHPVFKGMSGMISDKTINMFSAVDTRGVQPVDIVLDGSVCLATAPKRDEDAMAVAIHDVPAQVRHAGFTSRYLLVPLSLKSCANLTADGKKIISNAIDYLTDNETAQFSAPNLNITSFVIDGKAATINQNAATIELIMPAGTNLAALSPVISLAGVGTYVTPASNETIDFSKSGGMPIEYVVSDMINTKVYNVKVKVPSALEDTEISNIFFDGNFIHNADNLWLCVYDIFGRKVALSNADIDMTAAPAGVYLIQTANGTLKIIK